MVVNLIVRGLLKEFYDVLCEMRLIDNGTTKIKVCYSAEEMREMSYGINGMLERIQKQNEESIKREAALKDTAIRAMQNQINAHFIYNVLESIKMMAEINEEYTISDAVTALGEMLHYNMRWNKFLVTVQDEMNYIQNYVELMNLRYDFTITLSVQMPENLYRQDIPKMSLQPIVENAITHGIEELDADAVIEIKGIEHEKSFEIEITDSGIGMSEKQLAILRRKLRMRLNSDTQPKHGIGLRNVQDRIHIQFGTEYGLSVYTKEHCYTKVSIHLPITRGKYSPMDQEGDEKEEEKEHHKHLKYIKSVDTRVDATFGTSAINLQNLRNEIQRMLEMARVNVDESFDAFLAGSSKSLDDVDKREDYIDYLNKEISRAAAKMMAHEANVKASKNIGSYLDMTSNIERIGDHAVNICDYTKLIEEKQIVFSDSAKQQMKEMKMICEKMFHNISKEPDDTQAWLQKVHDSENFIDQKTEEFYESHLERINKGECNDEACIIFSEMLTDFERIGDHAWNVAKQMAKIIERG